jgi:hypothetical protein
MCSTLKQNPLTSFYQFVFNNILHAGQRFTINYVCDFVQSHTTTRRKKNHQSILSTNGGHFIPEKING